MPERGEAVKLPGEPTTKVPGAKPLVWKGFVEGSVGWEMADVAKGLVHVP